MKDKEYFNYLKGRSVISFLTRKFLYKPLIKEFRGKVLDIGCGLGEFLEIYRNSSGIDINPYCIRYCKEKGFDAKLGNVTKIPYASNSFSGIFCLCVLEHLKRPKLAVKEMRRVLKKGGKLVLIVPSEGGYKRDKTHVRFWGMEDLKKLLEENGFRIRRIWYFPFKFKLLRDKIYFNELRVIATKK